MDLSTDGEKAVCPYCGHEMLIDMDDSAQQEYERRIAMARAEEDIKDLQRNRQRKRRLKGWLPDLRFMNLLFPAQLIRLLL